MDVSTKLLPQSMSRPTPAPVPRPDEKKSEDSKAIVPKTPSPSPSLSVRDELVAELLNHPIEYNTYYDGTPNGWTDSHVGTFANAAVSFAGIAQGSGASQRLGDSVRVRRIHINFHIRSAINTEPGGSPVPVIPPLNNEYSHSYRIIIGIDKMPAIGAPQYITNESYDIGASYPFSQIAVFTNPRANFVSANTAYPGMNTMLTFRNPQTLSRYRILHDQIYNPSSKYDTAFSAQTAGSTDAGFYQRTASGLHSFIFDMKGMIIQWYDQSANTSYFANRPFFFIISDAPTAYPNKFKWSSAIEFENVA